MFGVFVCVFLQFLFKLEEPVSQVILFMITHTHRHKQTHTHTHLNTHTQTHTHIKYGRQQSQTKNRETPHCVHLYPRNFISVCTNSTLCSPVSEKLYFCIYKARSRLLSSTVIVLIRNRVNEWIMWVEGRIKMECLGLQIIPNNIAKLTDQRQTNYKSLLSQRH